MKLNTDRLNAFFQVALERNFHRAADTLCITQSALSQRILKLEQEIKTNLLVRGNDGVRLTEAGSILFEYIRDLQLKEHEVLGAMTGRSSAASGIIRIASFSSVLRSVVMPALRSLIKSNPDVFVEFFSRELRELPDMLESGEADFIISDNSVQADNLTSITLGVERLVHARCKGEVPTQPPTFLDHDAEDTTTYNFFKAQGINDIDIQRSFFDDIYGLVDGVKLGFGEAVISAHILNDMSHENFDIIPHPVAVTNPVILYYQTARYLGSLQKDVIQELLSNSAGYLDQ